MKRKTVEVLIDKLIEQDREMVEMERVMVSGNRALEAVLSVADSFPDALYAAYNEGFEFARVDHGADFARAWSNSNANRRADEIRKRVKAAG